VNSVGDADDVTGGRWPARKPKEIDRISGIPQTPPSALYRFFFPARQGEAPMKNHCADPKPVAEHKFQSGRDTGLLLFIKALSLSPPLSLSFIFRKRATRDLLISAQRFTNSREHPARSKAKRTWLHNFSLRRKAPFAYRARLGLYGFTGV